MQRLKTGFALLLMLLLLGCSSEDKANHQTPNTKSGLEISNAWLREVPIQGMNGAGYLTITNHGPDEEQLMAVNGDFSQKVEIHETTTGTDGIMNMTSLPDGVTLKAGESLAFEPGKKHIMLSQLKHALKANEQVTLDLVFANAGTVPQVFEIRSLSAIDH